MNNLRIEPYTEYSDFFSDFEISVIDALSRGLHSKEIAEELSKSRATIEAYIRTLYAKLNARSRAHVVAQAFHLGLLKSGTVSHERQWVYGGN